MGSRADLGTSLPRAALGGHETLERFVVPNATLFLRLARQAAAEGDIEHACQGYRQCLATWRRANTATGGRFRHEEELADLEFSAFLLGQVPEAARALAH